VTISPTFKVIGAQAIVKSLWGVERNSRFGIARAMTKTAKSVETGLKREMREKTDRPTPFFMKSTFVAPATRQKLVARVGLKDRLASKNLISAAERFGHHFSGGARVVKAIELHLRRAGLLGSNEFVVPGAGAKMDRYGNMSRGQIQQIMSQLRVGLDPYAYSSNSPRSRRNVRKAGHIFWARGNARDSHLKRGAYIDMGPPIGLRPLLVVVSSTNYQRIYDLPKLAATTIKREWSENLKASLVDAFNSAK